MNIHIITGHFYPQLHPRAFRANELALEFARRGDCVMVTNCWTIEGFNYDEYAKKTGITIRNLNIFRTGPDGQVKSSLHRVSKNSYLKRIMEYFFDGTLFFRGPLIAKRLYIKDDTELVIVLSTPFTCHFGYSIYCYKKSKKWFAIADSGDPFYGSKQNPVAIWFKYLTRWVYKRFNYVTIPTENAISIYTQVVPETKIRVIPQGFRMDNLRLYNGERSKPVKFAYAGVFYRDIRNPEFLFNYLANQPLDFEFHLFLRNTDSIVDEMIEKYPVLKEKIHIKYSLPHDDLLYELSKMHFLVNIENESNTQMPSKLIDYGMAGRPIYSCKKSTFSDDNMRKFLEGDYSNKYEINIDDYNIVKIAEQFHSLYEKSKELKQ